MRVGFTEGLSKEFRPKGLRLDLWPSSTLTKKGVYESKRSPKLSEAP